MRYTSVVKLNVFLILLVISFFGLLLRVVDYAEIPPINENFDEVHYAWGGGTWLKEGSPRSWSYFDSYTKSENIEKFGERWRIVEPVIEKPPLYFWLSGIVVLTFGPEDVFEVSHKTIRILPLILSFFTIFLTGLLAKKVFGNVVAIVSTLVYAVVPTIVMANRLSVTENLLTPLMLGTSVLMTLVSKNRSRELYGLVAVGALALLGALTKQVGVALGLGATVFYLTFKNYKFAVFAFLGMILGVCAFVFIGLIYDAQLFFGLMGDLRTHVLSGLPAQVPVIFSYPGISAKNRLFFDESVLLGLILLLASPFLFKEEIKNRHRNIFAFLVFPLTFIAVMVLGQAGWDAFDYFVIYIYPLFPFAIILLSKIIVETYEKRNIFAFLVLLSALGSGVLRFLLVNFPREYHHHWQNMFILIFAVSLTMFLLRKFWKKYLILLFAIYLVVNVFAVINLKNTYEAAVESLQFTFD